VFHLLVHHTQHSILGMFEFKKLDVIDSYTLRFLAFDLLIRYRKANRFYLVGKVLQRSIEMIPILGIY
jgi:hypothetical protein